MALKRSGVRASSAPSYSIGFFQVRPSSVALSYRHFSHIALIFFVGIFLFGLAMPSRADRSQVGILVSPQGNNLYRVAISYPKRMAAAKVMQEIAALVQNTQGNLLSPPIIQDYSLADDPGGTRPISPEQLQRFPVTTSVQFVISYMAPSEQAFAILPAYIGAFRAEKNLQVIFVSRGEQGELSSQEFVTPEMKVILTRSVGVERYEVQIRAAKGNLPAPIFSTSQKKTQEFVKPLAKQPTEPKGLNLSRIVLVVLGGLGAGVSLYLAATRLTMSPKTLK